MLSPFFFLNVEWNGMEFERIHVYLILLSRVGGGRGRHICFFKRSAVCAPGGPKEMDDGMATRKE